MDEMEQKLSKACVHLLVRHPFFGHLVHQFERIITPFVKTAMVTHDGRMLFNPDFVCKCSVDELVFLVAHEVMHIVMAHAVRRGPRDPHLYNIACDAVINETLIEEYVGAFIPGGIRMDGAQNTTSELIYKQLVDEYSKHACQRTPTGGSAKNVSQKRRQVSFSSKACQTGPAANCAVSMKPDAGNGARADNVTSSDTTAQGGGIDGGGSAAAGGKLVTDAVQDKPLADAIDNDKNANGSGLGRKQSPESANTGLRDPSASSKNEELTARNDDMQTPALGDELGTGRITDGTGNSSHDPTFTSELYKGRLNIVDLPGALPPMTEEQAQEQIARGRILVGQASAIARSRSLMSGALERFISCVLESKQPWYELLEQYMVAKASQRYNWCRPDKRRLSVAYLPRREPFPSMGTVVLGVDVSGSITNQEIAEFFGHCKAIFELCRPKRVYVVYCTTRVMAVDEFDRADMIAPRRNVWSGGTHMPAIMEWIIKQKIDADTCITFTDGFTDYPLENQVPCPLVWVLSVYNPPLCDPHGEVIYLEPEPYFDLSRPCRIRLGSGGYRRE